MSTPDDMTAFVRVVEKGSFAGAAKDFSLTPSAVSKLITRLEQRLGVQLLTRTTRRLALTAEGEIYLERCRDILAAIESAEAEIGATGTAARGQIRVNSGTAIGRHQIVRLLPDFLKDHPAITVDLALTDRQIDPIAENVDVVVRTGALADSSLVARKLADGRRMICASPAYLERNGAPKRPADLLNHSCITFTGAAELSRWPFYTPEGINRLQVSGDVSTDSADAMLDLALAGHGIIRMIDVSVAEPVAGGLLTPLFLDEHVDEPFPIWALTPPGRNRVPRVRAFLDYLVARLGDAPWRLERPAGQSALLRT